MIDDGFSIVHQASSIGKRFRQQAGRELPILDR
jgi:hypothetical protein